MKATMETMTEYWQLSIQADLGRNGLLGDGNRIWLKNVYRRKFYAGGIHYGYEYGTIFDVLMDNESWQ